MRLSVFAQQSRSAGSRDPCRRRGSALARYRADGEPGLIRLYPDRPDLVRDIWIGVHVDMRHMPRVRAVTDAVVEALRKNAAILNPGR